MIVINQPEKKVGFCFEYFVNLQFVSHTKKPKQFSSTYLFKTMRSDAMQTASKQVP